MRRYLARKNFVDYNRYVCPEGEEPQEHHQLICNIVQMVLEGKLKNVMFFLPPGSAKSTYLSVRLPAYYVSTMERKNVIAASYADTLASLFGKRARSLLMSPEHRALFTAQLTQDSKAKGEWETDNDNTYYACGVGGSVTGRRGDLGIIDDPVRSRQDADSEVKRESTWQWYLSDFKTRLKPEASTIIIMTRWHEDDLAGRILPEDYDGESGMIQCHDEQEWFVVNLPAEARDNDMLGRKPGEWLWPEWFTPDFWEQLKAEQPPRNWNSLYQQTPVADDGEYFKRDWFDRFTHLPANLVYYMSGDYAVKANEDADYTCIGVWGVDENGYCYLVDWWIGKEDNLTYIEHIIMFIKSYKPAFHVAEQGVIRQSIEPLLKRRMRQEMAYTTLKWSPTQGDKAAKARSFQGLAQNRVIRLPEELEDGELIMDQLIKFPTGRHDDCVDMCSEFGRAIASVWEANEEPPDPEDEIDKANQLDNGIPILEMFDPL